ncbi:hypothetical protein TWF730_005513 [Orbilia blumenaviensis]|uniref:Peptidase M10 metallopeptidase domain-containing protein n=1 Tax=Orbilia blumenaviensis TaxID=1796055 RepID=A0AAV9VKR9_9PEZI
MFLPKPNDVAGETQTAIDHIISHLTCFNCLPAGTEAKYKDPSDYLNRYAALSTGLHKFQKSCGLPKTGVFNHSTATLFNKPHCHGDIGTSSLFNPNRVGGHGFRTGENRLTYCFAEYSHQISVEKTRSTMVKAFKAWAEYSIDPVEFVEVAPHPGKGDIVIRWTKESNGRLKAGGWGVVVHPPEDHPNTKAPVEMIFDENEDWSTDTLESVVFHQVGHLFGLPHSENKATVMWPLYTKSSPKIGFKDIQAIWLKSSFLKFGVGVQLSKPKAFGTQDKTWDLTLDCMYTPKKTVAIIPAPNGGLYAIDERGSIQRYKRSSGLWERIYSAGEHPVASESVSSVHYIYRIDEYKDVWRCRHTSRKWEKFKSGGSFLAIASSYECKNFYMRLYDGDILAFDDSDTDSNTSSQSLGSEEIGRPILATGSKVYEWTAKGDIFVHNEEIDCWDIIGSFNPEAGSRLIGSGDTLYKLESGSIYEWTKESGWNKLLDPRARATLAFGQRLNRGAEMETNRPDFATAKSHRYITSKQRRGVLYNKKTDDEGGVNSLGDTWGKSITDWKYFETPTHIEMLAATGDDLYYLDKYGTIRHIQMEHNSKV